VKLIELAEFLSGKLTPGAVADTEIMGISSLDLAKSGEVTFISNTKFADRLNSIKASAVILPEQITDFSGSAILVKDPYLAYAKTAQLFENSEPVFDAKIHESAVIDSTAKISEGCSVGPLSVIGKGSEIGSNTVISASSVIENSVQIGENCRIDSGVIIRSGTVIGDRVIIQSGTVIGSEGFGNAMDGEKFVRIPCFGNVVIEDDVEIGANVTIDRGNFTATFISKGTRIDNLVMIAHNVEIGKNCAMAAQVGISGSTELGDSVILAGQVGLAGHLKIGDRSFVGAKAGVSKSVEPDSKITGYPARDLMKTRRIEAAQMYLPEMRKQLKKIEKKLKD